MSQGQSVSLSAPSGSILEPTNQPVGTPAVTGETIVLSADSTSGSIGAATNPLEIDAPDHKTTLTSSSGQNTYITQPQGDLGLDTVTVSNGGTAFISAPAGNIVNSGDPDGQNILAGKTFLFASGNIGTASLPITTVVGTVGGQSTTGDLWLENMGALVIGASDGNGPAIQSGGTVNILAHSPVEVTQDIKSKSRCEHHFDLGRDRKRHGGGARCVHRFDDRPGESLRGCQLHGGCRQPRDGGDEHQHRR